MARLIRNPDGSFRVEADEPLPGQARSSYYDPRTAGQPGITTRPSPKAYSPFGSGVKYNLGSGTSFTTPSPTQTWTSPFNMGRNPQGGPGGADPNAVIESIRRRRAAGPMPQSPSGSGKSFIPGFAAGGTPTLNPSLRPRTPFVSRPGQTRVNGVDAGAPRPVSNLPGGGALPGSGQAPGGMPGGMGGMPMGPQDPMDRLKQLAMQLAGGVGAYPGAVETLLPEMPHFDRWQRDQDLSGIFDPIEAEYAPVIDTLYNNLQGSMGNIQQNMQNQWGEQRGALEGQWAGLEQDQQTAFAEKDAELRRLATELGVPESAMMTDPNLERWGRENERLKQLNATLKTGSMGTLDTLAQSTEQGIGAYNPALEAAQGQTQADMLLGLSQQKGQLGSDLMNLESQYNSQASLGEMDLYQQLMDSARQNSTQEYDRRVQGWGMRNEAAQGAMQNWEDFYLQKQKQDQEAAAASQQSDMFERFMQAQDTTTSENASMWEPVNRRLEQEGLMEPWQSAVYKAGSPNEAMQQIMKMSSGPNIPRYEGEGTSAFINRLAPGKGIFNNALKIPRAVSKLRTGAPSAEVQQARTLEQILREAGLFPALFAGQMGLPGQKVTTTNQNRING